MTTGRRRGGSATALVMLVLSAWIGAPSGTAIATADSGQALYNSHCAPCHGEAGEGFRNLYPPIADSRFLTGELSQLPCIIRYGLRGEIAVGERGFNQLMPGNQRLSTEEITLLMGYMLRSREKRQSELKIDQWLEACEQ